MICFKNFLKFIQDKNVCTNKISVQFSSILFIIFYSHMNSTFIYIKCRTHSHDKHKSSSIEVGYVKPTNMGRYDPPWSYMNQFQSILGSMLAQSYCGRSQGLVKSVAGAISTTVCCKPITIFHFSLSCVHTGAFYSVG